MITTITLNAAIDKTFFLSRFELGKVSRVDNMYACPGGKGINVARVIHLLGGQSLASGYVGGSNGDFIEKELDKQGIAHDFVRVDGESRICLNIIDLYTKASTEILEPGPTIHSTQIEQMKQKVKQWSRRSEIIIFSGSVPKGVPANIYAELITIAKAEGTVTFLDASGDALLHGVKANPFFIKPNEEEVRKLIGRKPERESDLYDGMLELLRQGIECVIVSLGSGGCVAGYRNRLYRVKAPSIKAVNTVGCGDSLVAGMAVAISGGQSVEDGLRLAIAAGTANALTAEAGNVRIEDVDDLLGCIEVITIM